MAGMELECCESTEEVHQELIGRATEHMPREEELYDLAELFKVFGDSTRRGFCMYSLRRSCASATSHRHLE